MVVSYQLALGATAKRLSDVYGGTPGAQPDEAKNIPYRQLIVNAITASASIGTSSAVTVATGMTLSLAPISFGPFEAGPLKLSDLWVAGTGATVNIIGVPF